MMELYVFIKIVLTSTWASSPGASGDIALIKLKKPITYTRTGICTENFDRKTKVTI